VSAMFDAAERIRADLAAEQRTRARRGGLLLVLWAGMAAGLTLGIAPRAGLQPADVLAAAIAGAFILFGAATAFSPNLRFGTWAARAIGLVAIFSPLLAARVLHDHDGPLLGSLGCFGTISALGFGALVVGRVALGGTRRRFGGAPRLQGVAAAMIGVLAVGLHCPLATLPHLATHVAGALVVAALLRRLLLSDRR
jgi:hypothetical protein